MKWSNKVHKLMKCFFHHIKHAFKDLFVSFISVVTQCVGSWCFHNICLVSDAKFLTTYKVSNNHLLSFLPTKFLDAKAVSNDIGKVFLQTPCLWKGFHPQSHISVTEAKMLNQQNFLFQRQILLLINCIHKLLLHSC